MKFDYDRAWKEATQMLSANRGLLAVIAGIFLFLPYALLMILLPGMEAFANPDPAADPDAVMAAMTEFYRQYWWALLALALIQAIGMLAMLALLKRQALPTVGEALAVGAKAVLPYFAAQILQSLALVLVSGLLVGIGMATQIMGLAIIGGFVAIVLCVYVVTKLSLVGPVMAIDGVLNPITALKDSWRLTRRNSVRLFFFYLLILVACIVVSTIFSMLASLIFALLGEQAALFGAAVTSAFVNAAIIVLFMAILAAVHAQLARLQARESDPANA